MRGRRDANFAVKYRSLHLELDVHVTETKESLGLSLQWCNTTAAAENVWHILDVSEGSPADRAGLIAHSDFIVGTKDIYLHGESALGQIIEQVW